MKNTNKIKAVQTGLVALVLPLFMAGCATEAEFLTQTQPAAVNTALSRGRFELNCPNATGTVLSKKMTYINGVGIGMGGGGGYEWGEYTVGVKGCGKSVVYETMCRDSDNCNAFAGNGRILDAVQGQ